MEENIQIQISEALVKPGFWDTDEGSEFAVAMDGDDGELVWHRSNDWRLYGRMQGWSRVARIRPDYKHWGMKHNQGACGEIVPNPYTLVADLEQVTCPACLRSALNR